MLKSGTLTAHYSKSLNSTLDEPVVICERGGQMIATSGGVEPIQHGTSEIGVRRLSPLECERLQGFPDNWTEGQSDAQRYRQMGNAVAVPVVEWLANRLVEADSGRL